MKISLIIAIIAATAFAAPLEDLFTRSGSPPSQPHQPDGAPGPHNPLVNPATQQQTLAPQELPGGSQYPPGQHQQAQIQRDINHANALVRWESAQEKNRHALNRANAALKRVQAAGAPLKDIKYWQGRVAVHTTGLKRATNRMTKHEKERPAWGPQAIGTSVAGADQSIKRAEATLAAAQKVEVAQQPTDVPSSS